MKSRPGKVKSPAAPERPVWRTSVEGLRRGRRRRYSLLRGMPHRLMPQGQRLESAPPPLRCRDDRPAGEAGLLPENQYDPLNQLVSSESGRDATANVSAP